jgi:hypothetical protein
LTFVGVVIAPPAANAVAETASGVRCTIVGTAGNDVLTGTSGRDVICGRGGNDVIRAGAGNDVVDGGAGHDRLLGADGSDVLLGGPGRDTLVGEAGNDRLVGGDGADRELGGGGSDVVNGNLGDDDLTGGAGSDQVDGGAGFNLCDVAGVGDQQVRCAIDKARPVVGRVTVSPATVDVSSASQMITFRARVTDDTGVKQVQIGNIAWLVSGTPRDGVWESVMRVPRFITPGPRDVELWVTDRVGRQTSESRSQGFTIVNSVVDQERPVLQSLTLSAGSLDVRTASKTLRATVRVTDDLAGPTDLYVCPSHAWPDGGFGQDGACTNMERTSGSLRDSIWQGSLTIPRGAPSGTWNVSIWISDASGNFDNDFWLGPDEMAASGTPDEPRFRAIPNGAGAFDVVGVTPDMHAPQLTSLTLSPSRVDTSSGAVRVTAEMAGTDVEGITGAALFISGYAGYPNNATWTDLVDIANVESFQRVSGTAKDGVWRATFLVPGGTPDGEYFIQAALQDAGRFESWVSEDSAWTADNHVLDDTLAPTGTRFVVANSG